MLSKTVRCLLVELRELLSPALMSLQSNLEVVQRLNADQFFVSMEQYLNLPYHLRHVRTRRIDFHQVVDEGLHVQLEYLVLVLHLEL